MGTKTKHIFLSLSLFFFLAMLHGLWDLSSPTRYRTHPLGSEAQSPNYWTTSEFPKCVSLTINHSIPVPLSLVFLA